MSNKRVYPFREIDYKEEIFRLLESTNHFGRSEIYLELIDLHKYESSAKQILKEAKVCLDEMISSGLVQLKTHTDSGEWFTHYKLADPRDIVKMREQK